MPTAIGKYSHYASNPALMCARKFFASPPPGVGLCANWLNVERRLKTCLSSSHIRTQFDVNVIADVDLKLMRKFYALLSREVRSYFYSPIAYIVLIFFLLISGVDFYFQVSFMNQRQVQYSVQEAFFNSIFFWFAFVLIFPLITMRLFAEEFKLGTIEPLMTAPVRDWQVVLSKFFGALVFYLILWIPTICYFVIFQIITGHLAANSAAAYWGSYLMLLMLGMFYLSVGCLASVLTKNQIVAAIISFCAITLLFFLGLVQFILLDVSSATRDLLGYFSAIEHMATFSRSVIDTRPIVLYVSMTIVLLALTYQAFQSRKWRL